MQAYMRSAVEDGCTRRRRLRRGWSAERSARRVKCEGERVELSMALGQSGRLLSRGDDKMRASNENEPIVASQGRASCVGSTRLHMHAPANAHMHASALVLRDGGGHGRRDGRRTFCGGEDGDEPGALGMQGPWGRRQRADARHRPLRGYGPLSGGCGHSSVTLLGVGGAWFLVALSPRCISWCAVNSVRSRCLDLYGVLAAGFCVRRGGTRGRHCASRSTPPGRPRGGQSRCVLYNNTNCPPAITSFTFPVRDVIDRSRYVASRVTKPRPERS